MDGARTADDEETVITLLDDLNGFQTTLTNGLDSRLGLEKHSSQLDTLYNNSARSDSPLELRFGATQEELEGHSPRLASIRKEVNKPIAGRKRTASVFSELYGSFNKRHCG